MYLHSVDFEFPSAVAVPRCESSPMCVGFWVETFRPNGLIFISAGSKNEDAAIFIWIYRTDMFRWRSPHIYCYVITSLRVCWKHRGKLCPSPDFESLKYWRAAEHVQSIHGELKYWTSCNQFFWSIIPVFWKTNISIYNFTLKLLLWKVKMVSF